MTGKNEQIGSRVFSDGVCVFVFANADNPFFSKAILIICNLFFLSICVFSLTIGILGLTAFSLIAFLFLLRYALWNIYGKETLIINPKSLSYQYDYGFYRVPFKTKLINGPKLKITSRFVTDGKNQLSFISYDETTRAPILVHTMLFYLSDDEAAQLHTLVNDLFLDELSDKYTLPAINLN